MDKINIKDVRVSQLDRVGVKGGDVLHVLKKKDDDFTDFGEAYFSWVGLNKIKGWKKHLQMTMNLTVPVGNVRFVFASDNHEEFREEVIGVDRYVRLTVPPGIWFAFEGITLNQNLVLNIANIEHDKDEVNRCELSKINYIWS